MKTYYVTFEKQPSARTGNILFQYLISKIFSLKYGNTYIPIEHRSTFEITGHQEDVFYINEDNVSDILANENGKYQFLESRNIICDGFFQKSEYYIPYRAQLLTVLKTCDDYWVGHNGNIQKIQNFLRCTHRYPELSATDIVVSLRLDDFIQLPCPTSDIIPPQYYTDIIEREMSENVSAKLYIVCDTIRHDWEKRYLEFFQKWDPILIQEDLMHDCAIMRDCAVLLHSNSTLCWLLSFLSETKCKRYMVNTHFYGGQSLLKIEESDRLTDVTPLSHHDVYHLHLHTDLKTRIYPLSYCVPDECIVSEAEAEDKTMFMAPLIPGDSSTYHFGPTQEKEYYTMYRQSMCAYTQKKGGWDCLRHYEILANGCIPVFAHIDQCPQRTMTTLPKQLIIEASQHLSKWKDSGVDDAHRTYRRLLLQHMRDHCSTSATAAYILSKLPKQQKPLHVLLIAGHGGINYTRETSWIGLKRHIQCTGGVAIEYPTLDYLYDSFPASDLCNLVGNGFTYTRRLQHTDSCTNNDDADAIIHKIQNHYFDVIIYGKVGPDEFVEGSIPTMPMWNHVFKRYTRNEIVFLYGGDECTDMTTDNTYSRHLLYHSQFGHCFVREYDA